MSRLRLMGTPEEIAELLSRLDKYFILSDCQTYPCRGDTENIRLYAELENPVPGRTEHERSKHK